MYNLQFGQLICIHNMKYKYRISLYSVKYVNYRYLKLLFDEKYVTLLMSEVSAYLCDDRLFVLVEANVDFMQLEALNTFIFSRKGQSVIQLARNLRIYSLL